MEDLLKDALEGFVIRSIKDLNGTQKIQGFAQSIPAIEGKYQVVEWIAESNVVLTGITYSQSAWKSEDFWELWVDGDRLFETVYTKELGDQKHWEVIQPINKGQRVGIILHNNSGNSRDVWTDIEYIELIDNSEIEED